MKLRARDLGLPFPGSPGPLNAITDVPGVAVGFCTLTDPTKKMRTGVTAILPRPSTQPQPVWAGQYALNGNGEMTGTHWINDAGYFLGPILITNTHGVGAAHLGATRWMIDHYAEYFAKEHAWAMPVVAETYGGVLNDINALHVQPDHGIAALEARSTGPVAEGSTGGGNGMIAYEFKGGTGTASRRVALGEQDYTVAALVQANPGPMPQFAPAVTTRSELNIDLLDNLYLGAVQSIEKAVVNAMVAGEEVATVKPAGLVCPALDLPRLRKIFDLT